MLQDQERVACETTIYRMQAELMNPDDLPTFYRPLSKGNINAASNPIRTDLSKQKPHKTRKSKQPETRELQDLIAAGASLAES